MLYSFREQLRAAGLQLKQCHCSTSPRLDARLYSAGTPTVPRCQARFARCWHFIAIFTCRIETEVLALSDERNPLFLQSLIILSIKKASSLDIYFSVVGLT